MPDCGGAWEPGVEGGVATMDTVLAKLQENSPNGIVISGAVAWMAVQLDMHAEGVWMELAEKCWSPVETTEAKKALQDACGENLKELEGFNKKRQSKNKAMELVDIKDALMYLKGKDKMPLIMADVGMLMKSPQPGYSVNQTNEDIIERIDILEKAMTNFMGKTEKYMEDSKVQVEKLTDTVIRCEPKTPRLPLLQIPGQKTPNKKRRIEETLSVFQQPLVTVQQSAAPPVVQQQQQYSSVVAGVSALSSQQQEQIRSLQQLMNNQQKQQQKQQPPRQKNICYGTAKPPADSSNQTMLAADVSLVASGLDKECTEEKLKEFLEEKGIKPVEVVMMKKPEASEAETRMWRTKSFKVTVKASEHEKALLPEIWPYRVAVRYWRAERRPRQGGWDRQAATSGGLVSTGRPGPGQQQQEGRSRQNSEGWQQQSRGRGNSVRGGGQQQQQVMETSNMFSSLIQPSRVITAVETSQ